MSGFIINDVPPYNYYIANSGDTIFNGTFPILDDTDILVYLTPNGSPPNDPSQLLQLTLDYTVSNITQTGCVVTLVTGANAGDQIALWQNVPFQRLSNFNYQGNLPSATLNEQLNQLTLETQLAKGFSKALTATYPHSFAAEAGDLSLPPLAANQIWMKSSQGALIAVTLNNTLCSTLASELASETNGSDGSRLIGVNLPVYGPGTLHDYLLTLNAEIPIPTNINIAKDSADNSKQIAFNLTQLTTATTRTYTFPDLNGEISIDQPGDIKASFNSTQPGWIPLNDGTIGSASSGATTRANADTINLYTVLWSYSNTICPVSGGRGANAAADFAANKTLRLPLAAGRHLINTGTPVLSYAFTADAPSDLLTLSDTSSIFNGTALTVATTGVLPSPLVAATTYYAVVISSTTIKLSTTRANVNAGNVIDITSAGSGVNTLTITQAAITSGQVGGENQHQLITSELAAHTHSGVPVDDGGDTWQGGTPYTPGDSGSTGGDTPHNIMSPFTGIPMVIKL